MKRPIRLIYPENFPFDATYIYQDDDNYCVRLLNVFDGELGDQKILSIIDLKTPDVLAHRSIDMCLEIAQQKLYKIGGVLYYIAAENIFNRKGYPWRKFWKPSANIFFYIRMRGDRTLHIDETSMLTAVNKLHTNINSRQEGFTVAAQIFCRSPEDTITEAAKSITAKNGKLWGNVDIREAVLQTVEQVNTVGASRFLNLRYNMTAPQTVKPNETFIVKVQAMTGDGKNKAIVNYDQFDVEALSGYIPHTRVALKDGYGEFRATALGLLDGESMRIKFNRKHLTGMGECTILIKE